MKFATHLIPLLFLSLANGVLGLSNNLFVRSGTINQCKQKVVDVLIVGGGFSGLAAASRLEEFNKETNSKISYLVVEADNKVGGRGVAAFFLSGRRNPLLSILRDNGGRPRKNFTRADFENVARYDVLGDVRKLK